MEDFPAEVEVVEDSVDADAMGLSFKKKVPTKENSMKSKSGACPDFDFDYDWIYDIIE